MKKLIRGIAVFVAVLLLSGGAFALSDAEYKKFMKNADFADADQSLNGAWAEAKKKLLAAEFKALRKEQKEWIAKERDTEAKVLMEDGKEKVAAYTEVTMNRIVHINNLISKSFLKQNPVGAQGLYTLKAGKQTGTMEVYWYDQSRPELYVSLEVVYVLSPENIRNGVFSGKGDLKKDGTAVIADDNDPDAKITVKFKGDKAVVTTTDEFKQNGLFGMGVEADGTYTRQKSKK